jgi:hypothetical protein
VRAADNFWQVFSGSYNTAASWSLGRVPVDGLDDRAVIDNGGTATLSTPADNLVGAIALGLGANTSGKLQITGGSLQTSPSLSHTGGINVGVAGRGTLIVTPLSLLSVGGALVSGNNPQNVITMGGTPAGATATVSVGSATFGGTTEVYHNVAFDTLGTGASGNITLTPTSIYTPIIIAGLGVSTLDAGSGAVNLGGVLRPTFNSTPAAGASWNLFHAAAFNGNFTAIQPQGLGAGLRLSTSVTGSAGDLNLRLAVEQVLTLVVNRDARTISIANPAAGAVSFDGYAIQSSSGQLNRAAWNSLDDQNALGGDWLESTGSNNNRLSELKPTASGVLAGGGASVSLGSAYAPASTPPPLGTLTDDITFTYAQPDGAVKTGEVIYAGTRGINNIILQVDPASGNARIKNTSSYNVAIDGYAITSASGALKPGSWLSWDDQNISDWTESSGSDATRLAELKPTASTMMTGGSSTVSVGSIFTTSSPRDVVFQFLQSGQSTPTTGLVVYEPFPTGTADFDGDGDVDGRDFMTWQRNLGATGAAATLANGNANGDGVINAADLAVWRDQFGNVRPSSVAALNAVPEPVTWLMSMVAVLGGRGLRKSPNAKPSVSRRCRDA